MTNVLDQNVNTNFVTCITDYLDRLKVVIDHINVDQIQIVIEEIIKAYGKERFIYVFGNGGSASTASHLMADFNKVVSSNLEKKFRVLCLNDNIPIMLAISNDSHYNHVFKHQLESYLQNDDLVIAISGSGNSRNAIEAVEYANEKGATTIGFVGFDGGKLKGLTKYSVHIPAYDMQQVEDLHLIVQHLIAQVLMEHLNINKF